MALVDWVLCAGGFEERGEWLWLNVWRAQVDDLRYCSEVDSDEDAIGARCAQPAEDARVRLVEHNVFAVGKGVV